ncbi:MAG: ATP-grasp domain-containing protein [Bacilli bacterium]
MKKKFLPIILGSDENAYGIARSFHEEYGVTSLALCTRELNAVKYSNILKVDIEVSLHDEKSFLNILIEKAKYYSTEYENLILIPCSDYYTELVVKNKDILENYYVSRFVDKKYFDMFITKDKFYSLCDKYKMNYPKTICCTLNMRKDIIKKINFPYPIVLKPNNSNSEEYLNCSIEDKKKAYIINTEEELKIVLNKINKSTYKDNLIIQEFVPGDDTANRVLNCYSGIDGKVRSMCLGRPILEEYFPSTIGNYAAIISLKEENKIFDSIKYFLEDIKYKGFSNFDLKYDRNSNEYKLFEINPRQGRSSYSVTSCGINMAKLLVDDLIDHKEQKDIIKCKKEVLWLNLPFRLLDKYIENKEVLKEIKKLKKDNKVIHSLWYKEDLNLKRRLHLLRLYYIQTKLYRMYFIKK